MIAGTRHDEAQNISGAKSGTVIHISQYAASQPKAAVLRVYQIMCVCLLWVQGLSWSWRSTAITIGLMHLAPDMMQGRGSEGTTQARGFSQSQSQSQSQHTVNAQRAPFSNTAALQVYHNNHQQQHLPKHASTAEQWPYHSQVAVPPQHSRLDSKVCNIKLSLNLFLSVTIRFGQW